MGGGNATSWPRSRHYTMHYTDEEVEEGEGEKDESVCISSDHLTVYLLPIEGIANTSCQTCV